MDLAKAAAGAVGGAIAGAVVFILLARGAGVHAGMLMGAGAGWGVQLLVRERGMATGVIALVAGVISSVIAEWFAFYANNAFPFFLQHMQAVPMIHWLLSGAGVVVGFFWAKSP